MLNRHDFLRTLLATGLGATILGACGSDGQPDPDAGAGSDSGNPGTPDGNPGTPDGNMGTPDAFMGACAQTTVSIGGNHGHEMTVAAADLESTTPKMYDIRGTSLHTHTVTITPQQFATLKTTGVLMVTSSTDSAHPHTIRVTCA